MGEGSARRCQSPKLALDTTSLPWETDSVRGVSLVCPGGSIPRYSRGLGSLIDSEAPFMDRCSQT